MSDYKELLARRDQDIEKLVAALKSLSESLPKALEEAYCEGWADGSCSSAIGIHDSKAGWGNSETKVAVEIQSEF